METYRIEVPKDAMPAVLIALQEAFAKTITDMVKFGDTAPRKARSENLALAYLMALQTLQNAD